MEDFVLWVLGSLILFNYGSFLYALFFRPFMSFREQGVWMFFIFAACAVEGMCWFNYHLLICEQLDYPLWFIILGSGMIFSVAAILIIRLKFISSLKRGGYQFVVTKVKSQRVFGCFDSYWAKTIIPAKLITADGQQYKIGDKLKISVKHCYWSLFFMRVIVEPYS